MDRTALKKHEIYSKLSELSEQELGTIADFIDFMRQKRKVEEKRVIQFEGILKNYDIDLSDLRKFKEETWKHVDEEFLDG